MVSSEGCGNAVFRFTMRVSLLRGIDRVQGKHRVIISQWWGRTRTNFSERQAALLTEQKKLFVDEYIRTGCKNATQAAKNAGYSARSAGSQAHDLLKTPEVQAYLSERKAAFVKDIQEEFVYHAKEALDVLHEILQNPEAQDKDRISAAKEFLDRAGFKPPEQVTLSGEIKSNPFAGLTTDELRRLIK